MKEEKTEEEQEDGNALCQPYLFIILHIPIRNNVGGTINSVRLRKLN